MFEMTCSTKFLTFYRVRTKLICPETESTAFEDYEMAQKVQVSESLPMKYQFL